MLDLLIIMLERVGTIIAVAFILTRLQFFKNMIADDKLGRKQELTAILFFGFFGIIGTYFGVALHTSSSQFNNVTIGLLEDEAIANMRVIGIVIAGLLGGYRIGIGAGLVAGIHRMTLGGFTAVSCGISTIIAGIVSGYFYRKGKRVTPFFAFIICGSVEAMQMLIILGLSKPFEKALALVEVIGLPMILANGVGAAIFLLIVHNVISEREKTIGQQAQKSLRIADQTLAYLRKGMNSDTAKAVCEILHRELQPEAVALTNQNNVLAQIGLDNLGIDKQATNFTTETKQVIHSGELLILNDVSSHFAEKSESIGTIIVPLKQREKTIGTLKLYYATKKNMINSNTELITGLSKLLSNQLEIAEAERAYQLAKEAEIKVLQAQVNPHFLFNALNIIMSLIRTDPEEARNLLRSLSYFLRQNVTGTTASKVTLQQELSHVQAYLTVIEARFIDRLTVIYEVDDSLLNEMIPPFTLQPIIENAIQHGIRDMDENCVVKIMIRDQAGYIEISVQDNGRGIEPEKIALLGVDQIDSEQGTGMGLLNVNRRLVMTFGEGAAIHIDSAKDEGTVISFRILPFKKEEVM